MNEYPKSKFDGEKWTIIVKLNGRSHLMSLQDALDFSHTLHNACLTCLGTEAFRQQFKDKPEVKEIDLVTTA